MQEAEGLFAEPPPQSEDYSDGAGSSSVRGLGAYAETVNQQMYYGEGVRQAQLRLMSRAREWLEQIAQERMSYEVPPVVQPGETPKPPFPNTLRMLKV